MGDREQDAGDKRVEELILGSLQRIETKVDEGFGEMRGDITNLKVTVGKHDVILQRMEGNGSRLIPWLMLGWNVFIVLVGVIWWAAHLPH